MASIEKYLKTPTRDIERFKEVLCEFISENGKKLVESESKYRNIFNTSPDMIYITDLNGHLLDANDAWIKKMGITPKDFKDFNLMDFYGITNNIKIKDVIQSFKLGDIIYGFETKGKNIDGEIFEFEICSIPIEKDGKIIMVINIAHEISDQKFIENKSGESEEKYRLISENANDLIRLMSSNFEFEYANEKVHKRLLGYDNEDMIGKISLEFVNPQHWKKVIKSTRKYLKGEKSPYEVQFRCKNGDFRWFEVKAKVFHTELGEMKILTIARDINDRKLAELKLRESEEKYRLISETAYDLIGVLDHKFKYNYINENAFFQILGYKTEDLIGKSVLKYIHPDDVFIGAKALFEGFRKGTGVAEVRFRHNDGHWIWIEAKGQIFKDSDGNLKAIIISRDVSERKLNEQRLQESERKFRQLFNQISFYKDLFAHDINNILHVIRSSTELLSYQLGNQKTKIIEDLLKMIDKQIERGRKLMSNTSILSELEESHISIQNLKLCEVLEDSIEYIKKTHEERSVKITVKCDKEEDETIVKASYLLQDIFDNILLNAIKYNKNPQVEIYITVSPKPIEGINFLEICFEDNGIGIADEKKQLIFEKGNREVKGSKGMGLGLSIVKRILDSYQGKIWVEDKVKNDYTQGTRVVILLREIIN